MKIEIEIPEQGLILDSRIQLMVAPAGVRWESAQLGEYATRKGVYALHTGKSILYIGQTTGAKMDYGTRLRREFSETAAPRNHRLYDFLVELPEPIYSWFLDYEELDLFISSDPNPISSRRKALLMEQALLAIHEPPGNKV